MFHGRNELGQQFLSGVDLMIDLATLGEYGLEPLRADGSCRERAGRRQGGGRPGREALAATRRGACGHDVLAERAVPRNRVRPEAPLARSAAGGEWRFPGLPEGLSRPVDFRRALERYAA
jgi:hypothetical protein